MTSRRFTLRTRLVSAGYGVFYRLPQRWRASVVRLVTGRYVLGAVVLCFDGEPCLAGHGDGDAARPGFGADSLVRTAPAGGERLLLLRQPPGRGWTLPAGLLARGETPAEGACRELAEETGIRLTPADLTEAIPNAMVHTRGRWVDMVFTARVPASSVELTVDGAEVWEAAWHPIAELPPLTVATTRLLGYYGIGPGVPDPAGTTTAS